MKSYNAYCGSHLGVICDLNLRTGESQDVNKHSGQRCHVSKGLQQFPTSPPSPVNSKCIPCSESQQYLQTRTALTPLQILLLNTRQTHQM